MLTTMMRACKNRTVLFLVAPLMFAPVVQANNVFQESGGIVVMEVESEAPTEQWSEEQSIGGFRGQGYYVWRGEQFFNPASAGRGTISYRFFINTPGNYEMRWRSYIAHGNLGSDYNDSWARFPTGSNIPGQHGLNGWTKVFQGHLNEWSWDALTVDFVGENIRQFFSAGEHVMQISGRSFGHAIDRIALYRYEDMNFDPARFSDLPESTRSGSPAPAPEPVPQPEPEPQAEPQVAEPEPSAPEVVAQPVAEETSASQLASPVITDTQVYSSTAAEIFWGRGDASIVSYDVSLNGQLIDSTNGTSYFFDTLAPGSSNTVAIRSVASNGEVSNEATATLNTLSNVFAGSDSQSASDSATGGPTSPQGASVVVYSSTAAELFWTRAAVAEGVVGTDVFRDGMFIGVSPGNSYFDNTREPGQQYEYQLIANDGAGQSSEATVVTE